VIDINCPTCGIRMKHVTVGEQTHIKLEQCGDCKGIFFDTVELTDMKHQTFADWVRDRFARNQAAYGNAGWPKRLN
jgi:Zn-finger nucleic acid-binding protein